MNNITSIIPSFRRHENIPIIIKRLKNQTIPPERIIVWNDNSGEYGKDIVLDDKNIEVINTNTNWWSNYGSFIIGYLTNSDYITITDDDMPPGLEWFEYCLNNQKKTPGLYGMYGVIMTRNGYFENNHFKTGIGNNELIEVDMIGNSYFIPRKAINCMLSEKPPTFHHTCDLHLCYTAQKYGNFKCYVPKPSNENALSYYKPEELIFNKSERCMWNDPEHYLNREGYVKWAVKNGWKLLKDRNENSNISR